MEGSWQGGVREGPRFVGKECKWRAIDSNFPGWIAARQSRKLSPPRNIKQLKRNVYARHWNASKLTHFNGILMKIASSPRQNTRYTW